MNEVALEFLAAGSVFAPEDLVHWADPTDRGLDTAVTEAELLLTCPAATAAVPAELTPWLATDLTPDRQRDLADLPGRAVARRWAAIDPTVLYVENPHPRPILGLLQIPSDPAAATALASALDEVASHGSDVFGTTVNSLLARLLAERPVSPTRPITVLTLTTAADPLHELPVVLTLANRGDAAGNPLPEDPFTTMLPERVRMLADSLRTGFRVSSHDEVALNRDPAADEDSFATAQRFGRGPGPIVDAARLTLRREVVTGQGLDDDRVDRIAKRLRRSWAHYRTTIG